MDNYFLVANALWKQAKNTWISTAHHWSFLQIHGSFRRPLVNSRETYCSLWPWWKNGKGLVLLIKFCKLCIKLSLMIILDDIVPWSFTTAYVIPSRTPKRILFQHNHPSKQIWWLWPNGKMAWLRAPYKWTWKMAKEKKNADSCISFQNPGWCTNNIQWAGKNPVFN